MKVDPINTFEALEEEIKNNDVMLTTFDNPYDPFTQFDEWYNYDQSMGYCTCGLIDRVSWYSDELSELDQKIEVVRAINSILSDVGTEIYKKVTKQGLSSS